MKSFDKTGILNYILDVAHEKNISQAKLIEGIYDYSHFNRMCNGKESIKLEILLLCAQKLQIDLNKLVIQTYSDPARKFSLMKDEFQWITLKHDYLQLEDFYRSIQHLSFDDVPFRQFKKRIEAIIWGEIQHNYPKSLQLLFEALALTVHTKSIENIDFSKLSTDEIEIINDIAICYNALKDKKGVYILEKLISNMEANSEIRNHINLYFNLSSMYSTFENYKRKKEIADEGISLAVQYNDFINLSYLYYSRFIANICLGNDSEALRDVRDCYALMKMQNRLDFFFQILEDDIKQYNITLDLHSVFQTDN